MAQGGKAADQIIDIINFSVLIINHLFKFLDILKRIRFIAERFYKIPEGYNATERSVTNKIMFMDNGDNIRDRENFQKF